MNPGSTTRTTNGLIETPIRPTSPTRAGVTCTSRSVSPRRTVRASAASRTGVDLFDQRFGAGDLVVTHGHDDILDLQAGLTSAG